MVIKIKYFKKCNLFLIHSELMANGESIQKIYWLQIIIARQESVLCIFFFDRKKNKTFPLPLPFKVWNK